MGRQVGAALRGQDSPGSCVVMAAPGRAPGMWSPAPRPDTRSRRSGHRGGAGAQLVKPQGSGCGSARGRGENSGRQAVTQSQGAPALGVVSVVAAHAQLIKGVVASCGLGPSLRGASLS